MRLTYSYNVLVATVEWTDFNTANLAWFRTSL